MPEQFIDDFDLHLRRGTQTLIEGWVHVEGGAPEAQTTVSIPELNVNEAARLAHYPHDERMTRLADRMGILVWSEIPVYWAVEFDNPAVLVKAEQQLHEMIRRDRDKASIVLWSVANETPVTPAGTNYLCLGAFVSCEA